MGGTVFLMETSGIEDTIINTAALSFIISVDELLCSALFNDTAKHMLENIEPLVHISDELTTMTDMEAYEKNQASREWSLFSLKLYRMLFPVRLFLMVSVTGFFIWKYYFEHCNLTSDGSYVAKDVFLPKSYVMPIFSFLFSPFPGIFSVETQETAAWRMPDVGMWPQP